MAFTEKLNFVCRKCGAMHARRNLAVECCSVGDVLTTDELEAIGQQRLFGDSAESVTVREPVEIERNAPQLRLF
jgi:hypothetical protein